MNKKLGNYFYGSFPGYKILEIPYHRGSQDQSGCFSILYLILRMRKMHRLKTLIENFNADSGKMLDHQHFNLHNKTLGKVINDSHV